MYKYPKIETVYQRDMDGTSVFAFRPIFKHDRKRAWRN